MSTEILAVTDAYQEIVKAGWWRKLVGVSNEIG